MSAEARYVRSADGIRVHRADCRYVTAGHAPWNYADGFTDDQMLSCLASARWLLPCQLCKPGRAPTVRAGG